MASFTSITHKKPYVEISSAKSSLSKTGQTVLITGGASGIGYAITEAFAQASASNIIIVGRQADRLNIAVSKIRSENKFEGTITGRECDIADLSSVNKLWSQLRQEGVTVDILVLNAVHVSPIQRVLDGTPNEICVEFQTNVLASFEMTRLFFHQTNHSGQKKYLVNVSTMAVHDFDIAGHRPLYSVTKSAGTLLLQQIAKDTPSECMQVISYHPGAIWTDTSRNSGIKADAAEWDNVSLPGHFALWASSDEAEFLHGRFVWASWDVNELSSGELRVRIDTDPNYLKIGIKGL